MKRIYLVWVISHCFYFQPFSQGIGIGTSFPHASSVLEIDSDTKGILIPRMPSSGITSIVLPAKGLIVYDSVKHELMVNMGTHLSPNWQTIMARSGWNLTGNQETNSSIHFMGTLDTQPLKFKVNNYPAGELNPVNGNIFWGQFAGSSNTTGHHNIAIGKYSLLSNQSLSHLIAIGDSTMLFAESCPGDGGKRNVALGSWALYSHSCGSSNTAIGNGALAYNQVGNENTAIGAGALQEGEEGNENTAIGAYTLFYNNGGNRNTGIGRATLFYNIQGSDNTAIGLSSMFYHEAGQQNTATGRGALINGHSSYNTSIGEYALSGLSTAQYNTAIGNGTGNESNIGWNNTLIGHSADVTFTGQYNIVAIGFNATCPDHSMVRIGNTGTTSIGGYAEWTNISDGRYKRNVQNLVHGLGFITRLRPVTYLLDISRISNDTGENLEEFSFYSQEFFEGKEKTVYTGFIAQEVEAAAMEAGFLFSGIDKPRNAEGCFGIRYATFVMPLTVAIQELNTENIRLKAKLKEQSLLLNAVLSKLEKMENDE